MPAHFLYARFPAASHRAALDWMRAVDDVVAEHPSVQVAQPDDTHRGPVVGWRLVSENNREIARGCVLFSDERRARADSGVLMRAHEELVVHSAPAARARSTGWFATHGDVLVMTGARRYENRSAARNAGALAVRLIGTLAEGGSRAVVGLPAGAGLAG